MGNFFLTNVCVCELDRAIFFLYMSVYISLGGQSCILFINHLCLLLPPVPICVFGMLLVDGESHCVLVFAGLLINAYRLLGMLPVWITNIVGAVLVSSSYSFVDFVNHIAQH